MSNGEVATGCHEVDTSCNYGCTRIDTRIKCKSSTGYNYVLWNCGPAFFNPGCPQPITQQFYWGSHFCSMCCINKNCFWGMPKCFS